MGLKGDATQEYGHGDWIARIVDVTALFNQVGVRLEVGDVEGALELFPVEEGYPMPQGIAIMAPQRYKKAARPGYKLKPGAPRPVSQSVSYG